jgi:hypothetical protein
VNQYVSIIKRAWIHAGMEVNSNDIPVLSRNALYSYMIEEEGIPEGTVKQELKPSTKKMISTLMKDGFVFKNEITGMYEITDSNLISVLLLKKQAKKDEK